MEILKQSHDAITEFKVIVQEGQQRLDLAADVSDLGDELLVEFVQQLTVINQLDRQAILHQLELLDRFIHQLQYEQLRQTSARKPHCDGCGSHWRLHLTCNHRRHQ